MMRRTVHAHTATRGMHGTPRTRVVIVLLVLAALPAALHAQQLRLTGSTTIRYVELRLLGRDSVPVRDVPGTGLLRLLPDGRTVRCVPDDPFCFLTVPGRRVSAVPVLHDLEANAWGLGRGARLHAQLRLRNAWGSAAQLWPQAGDPLDVLAAYAELERDRYRLRIGRQWQVSGLGFYNFDGVHAGVAAREHAWAEAWVGRSLVRGMNEPRAGGALESIEPLPAQAAGLIAGARLRLRPWHAAALAATYQADFRTDGTGLHAELAAADGSLRGRPGTLDARVEIDVATAALNEARLRVRTAPIGRFVLHAQARHHRPYFELSTIWGAFSPVGFDEATAGATWSPAAPRIVLRVDGSCRRYGDAGTTHGLDTFRGGGCGVTVHTSWSPAPPWRLDASYAAEGGFGAARRDGHAGATLVIGDIGSVSLQALAFERLYEFRLTEGVVYGLNGEGAVRLGSRAQLFAGAALYRHTPGAAAHGMNWTQRRASVRLQWTAGAEPALRPWPAGGAP
jgi:hypothetical protein